MLFEGYHFLIGLLRSDLVGLLRLGQKDLFPDPFPNLTDLFKSDIGYPKRKEVKDLVTKKFSH